MIAFRLTRSGILVKIDRGTPSANIDVIHAIAEGNS